MGIIYRHININQVCEAFILEPTKANKSLPFDIEHGWQVVIYFKDGRNLTIDKKCKKSCKDLIDLLNLARI